MRIKNLTGDKRTPNTAKFKLLMKIGIVLLIIGLIIAVPAYAFYDIWNNEKKGWEFKEKIWHEYLLRDPDSEWAMNKYHNAANESSYAEDKVTVYFRGFLIGVIITVIGLLFIVYSLRNEIPKKIRNFIGDNRSPNTIKFSFAILSIICGIFLIFMPFLQYTGPHYELKFNGNVYVFQPRILHLEIFIPEIIILFLLGSVLLFVLRWQIRNGNENKRIDNLSTWLTICILLFIAIFFIGFIIAHDFLGGYSILDPLFGMIAAPIVICGSIYIILYLKKIESAENAQPIENVKLTRALMDQKTMYFEVITIFLLGIAAFSFLMTFILGSITPLTPQDGYWEGGHEKVALPGMNVSYNMILESGDGPATVKYVILGDGDSRPGENWSVSSKEVVLRPNERKIITFTNYVPANARRGDYVYNFYFIQVDEVGLFTASGSWIGTEVTYDLAYYNASQSSSNSYNLPIWGVRSSIYPFMIILGGIIFIAWVVISIFFLWNKRKALSGNQQ